MFAQATDRWVVYLKTVHGRRSGANAVCSQAEWDELESHRPGHHTLVRDGFKTENEAEISARGTAGDPSGRRS